MNDRADVASPARGSKSKSAPRVYDVLERPYAAYASLVVIGGLAAAGLVLDGRPAYVVLAIACMACGLPRAMFHDQGFVDPAAGTGLRTVVFLSTLYYLLLAGAAFVAAASTASAVEITLLGAVPLAAAAGVAVLAMPEGQRRARVAGAPAHGSSPEEGAWGVVEGTTRTEAGAVAGVAVAFAFGEHSTESTGTYNGKRETEYVSKPIRKHASELVVQLGEGLERRVNTAGARWCSTVRVKQKLSRRTTSAAIVHAQTRLRIAGTARGGELVASGGDELLVFGSLLAPADALARLRWREWTANGFVVAGVAGLVALSVLRG